MSQPKNIGRHRVLPLALSPGISIYRGAKKEGEEKTKRKGSPSELMYCESCKKVYQHHSSNNRSYYEYYEDMPTLGIERIPCPKCEAQ